jgi:hypothetical protein
MRVMRRQKKEEVKAGAAVKAQSLVATYSF